MELSQFPWPRRDRLVGMLSSCACVTRRGDARGGEVGARRARAHRPRRGQLIAPSGADACAPVAASGRRSGKGPNGSNASRGASPLEGSFSGGYWSLRPLLAHGLRRLFAHGLRPWQFAGQRPAIICPDLVGHFAALAKSPRIILWQICLPIGMNRYSYCAMNGYSFGQHSNTASACKNTHQTHL